MAINETRLYEMIGTRIREARCRMHPTMSQTKLATILALSRASVVNIEAGRQRPPIHVLWQIADALHTEVALLIPTQKEYLNADHLNTDIDPEMLATVDAFVKGDSKTRRLLTQFLGEALSHKGKGQA